MITLVKGYQVVLLVIKAPNKQREREIIAGNVCFYGAQKGKSLY